jgi:hypothetical protein
MRVSVRGLAGLAALGDVICETDADGNPTADCYDTSSGVASTENNDTPDCAFGGTWPSCNPNPVQSSTSVTTSGSVVSTQASSTAGASSLANLLAAAGTSLSRVLNPTQIQTIGGQQYSYNPTTGQYTLLSGSAITSLTPILLIGGVIFLVMDMAGGKH